MLKLKQNEVELTDEELDNLFDFPEDEPSTKEELDIKDSLPKSRTTLFLFFSPVCKRFLPG